MFYLGQFFISIKRANITGVLFVIFTAALLSVSFNKDKLSSFITHAELEHSNPYFNALISKDINLNSISRKINSLPGVERVKHRKIVDAKKELGTLNKELKSSVLERLKAIKYSSLTIELSQNLKIKSQNLVKEYLTRLVGENSLTLSSIKYPKQKEETVSFKDKFLAYADSIILAVVAFMWAVLFISVLKRNASYFYLVEKFQRKSNIKLKAYSFGVGLICTMTILANLYIEESFSVAPLGISLILITLSLVLLSKTKYKGPVV